MTGTPKRLCQSALTATATAIYTAVADGKTQIIDMMATNTSGNQRTLHVYVGSPNDTNCIIHHSKIAADDYLHIGQMFQIMNANETIYASADAAGVTLTISGLERI